MNVAIYVLYSSSFFRLLPRTRCSACRAAPAGGWRFVRQWPVTRRQRRGGADSCGSGRCCAHTVRRRGGRDPASSGRGQRHHRDHDPGLRHCAPASSTAGAVRRQLPARRHVPIPRGRPGLRSDVPARHVLPMVDVVGALVHQGGRRPAARDGGPGRVRGADRLRHLGQPRRRAAGRHGGDLRYRRRRDQRGAGRVDRRGDQHHRGGSRCRTSARSPSELGATHSAADAEQAQQLVTELTRGVGADHALITVGVVDRRRRSTRPSRPYRKRGTVVVTGLAGPGRRTSTCPASSSPCSRSGSRARCSAAATRSTTSR